MGAVFWRDVVTGAWVLADDGGCVATQCPVETLREIAPGGALECRVFSHPRPRLRIESPEARWGDGPHDFCAGPGAHELLALAPLGGGAPPPPHELAVGDVSCLLHAARQRMNDLSCALPHTQQRVVFCAWEQCGTVPAAQLLVMPRRVGRGADIDRQALTYMEHHGRCTVCDAADTALCSTPRLLLDGWAARSWATTRGGAVYIAPIDHEGDFTSASDETLFEAAAVLCSITRTAYSEFDGRYCVAWAISEHAPTLDIACRHWHITAVVRAALPLECELAGLVCGIDIADAGVNPSTIRDHVAKLLER